jgi:hypothetical protein
MDSLLGDYESDEDQDGQGSDNQETESAAVKDGEALSSLASYLHEGVGEEDGENRKAEAAQKSGGQATKSTMSPSPFCQVSTTFYFIFCIVGV